jgi:hypothetical protein
MGAGLSRLIVPAFRSWENYIKKLSEIISFCWPYFGDFRLRKPNIRADDAVHLLWTARADHCRMTQRPGNGV